MRKRERAAALSAVGLMFIAGCSGGRSVGPTPPAIPNGGGGSQSAVSAPHNAALQIMIPQLTQVTQPASDRRSAAAVRHLATARRHPTWISPYSAYLSLQVVPANGGPTFTTSFSLSSCTSGYTASYEPYLNCPVNVPYGSNTFYVSLYDSSNNLLSTNLYGSPAPQTVNPNGSSASNTISIYEQGVVSNIQQESPTMCWSAYPQAIPIEFNDADGFPIFGPLANPITPHFTAYNGAGLGAINVYAIYFNVNGPQGSYTPPVAIGSVNNVTLYDTSIYAPYFWISGSEGAINVTASVANIPMYNNGAYTFTSSAQGYVATGTYMAWGIGSNSNYSNYGLYTIAVQTSTHQAIPCYSAVGPFNQWTNVAAFDDPTSHTPYLVVGDGTNVVHLYDAYVTAEASGRAYAFFQGANSYGYNPGLQFDLAQSSQVAATGPIVNLITSNPAPGRVFLMQSAPTPGTIDILNFANGIPAGGPGPYMTQIGVAGGTRIAGESGLSPYALYYDQATPSFSTWLYGFYTGGPFVGGATAYQNLSTYLSGGDIYALAPSGSTYVFVRGGSQLCDFDSNNFGAGLYCNTIPGAVNQNPITLAYDSATSDLLWTTGAALAGNTMAYAESAQQSPATFQTGIPTATAITLPHNVWRFVNTTATPGIVGFYGGPLTCTVAPYTANSGEITWMQYSGGTWNLLASVCWPNTQVTLTYP